MLYTMALVVGLVLLGMAFIATEPLALLVGSFLVMWGLSPSWAFILSGGLWLVLIIAVYLAGVRLVRSYLRR